MNPPLKKKYRVHRSYNFGVYRGRTNPARATTITLRPHFRAMKAVGESTLALQKGTYGI